MSVIRNHCTRQQVAGSCLYVQVLSQSIIDTVFQRLCCISFLCDFMSSAKLCCLFISVSVFPHRITHTHITAVVVYVPVVCAKLCLVVIYLWRRKKDRHQHCMKRKPNMVTLWNQSFTLTPECPMLEFFV